MRETRLLLVILLPLYGLLGWGWQYYHGPESRVAFLQAAVSCGLWGMVALLCQEWAMRRGEDLAGALGTIPLRTVGPMLAAIGLAYGRNDLAREQIFQAFVACYLLTLLVETILSVCLIRRWEKVRESPLDSPDLPS